jgi:hypothetical protein
MTLSSLALAPRAPQNFFPTLNDALASEDLIDSWPISKSLTYGETFGYTFEDGSRHGRYVSIYRDEKGLYERPIHYRR